MQGGFAAQENATDIGVGGKGVGGTRTGLPPQRDGFTPQQIDLGRYLFFDPLLSGEGTMSCASCHQPDKGFGDGLPRSVGAHGREVARSAPSLWNAGLQELYFWDGRATSLGEQMQGPLYAAAEMGTTPERLLETLSSSAACRELFSVAFPGERNGAIALTHKYQRVLQTFNRPI